MSTEHRTWTTEDEKYFIFHIISNFKINRALKSQICLAFQFHNSQIYRTLGWKCLRNVSNFIKHMKTKTWKMSYICATGISLFSFKRNLNENLSSKSQQQSMSEYEQLDMRELKRKWKTSSGVPACHWPRLRMLYIDFPFSFSILVHFLLTWFFADAHLARKQHWIWEFGRIHVEEEKFLVIAQWKWKFFISHLNWIEFHISWRLFESRHNGWIKSLLLWLHFHVECVTWNMIRKFECFIEFSHFWAFIISFFIFNPWIIKVLSTTVKIDLPKTRKFSTIFLLFCSQTNYMEKISIQVQVSMTTRTLSYYHNTDCTEQQRLCIRLRWSEAELKQILSWREFSEFVNF